MLASQTDVSMHPAAAARLHDALPSAVDALALHVKGCGIAPVPNLVFRPLPKSQAGDVKSLSLLNAVPLKRFGRNPS